MREAGLPIRTGLFMQYVDVKQANAHYSIDFQRYVHLSFFVFRPMAISHGPIKFVLAVFLLLLL